jgi:hypothetical protein
MVMKVGLRLTTHESLVSETDAYRVLMGRSLEKEEKLEMNSKEIVRSRDSSVVIETRL